MSQKEIILVASVSVMRDKKVLIIKENKPTAVNKWNFPSGRVDYGEDILDAARREVIEETALDVKLTGSTGVYNFRSNTDNQVILFHFIGEVIGGSLTFVEEEITEGKWIELNELNKWKNEDLREASVMRQMINNVLNENIHSTSLFNEQLST